MILAPLFAWLKDAFSLVWAKRGFSIAVFFNVSGMGQAVTDRVVNRVGAHRIFFQVRLQLYPQAGLITITTEGILVSDKGRLFVRGVDLVSDKYLRQPLHQVIRS